MEEVRGGRIRVRPRLDLIDDVKVALGSLGMTWRLHDNARKVERSGEPWYICR